MLPSLCLAMAANPFVSRFPGLPEAAGRGGADSHLASIPLAGSIGTWIVARLFCAVPAVAAPTPRPRRAAARKEPPVAGACMVGEVLG